MIPGLAEYLSEEEEPKRPVVARQPLVSPFSVIETETGGVEHNLPPSKAKKQRKLALPKPKLGGAGTSDEALALPPSKRPTESYLEDQPQTKKLRLSGTDLRPPQVRHSRQNIATEDLGSLYSQQHIKEKEKLTKRRLSSPSKLPTPASATISAEGPQ